MKQLIVFLLIAMFVIAGCGGNGGGDADTGGDTGGGEAESTSDTAIPENATDKGAIAIGETLEGEIESASDIHSYTLTVASGDDIKLSINATGSAFTSPYIFLYGPDGELVDNTDTNTSSRSASLTLVVEAEGDYTIIVQSFDGKGEEPYALIVEEN